MFFEQTFALGESGGFPKGMVLSRSVMRTLDESTLTACDWDPHCVKKRKEVEHRQRSLLWIREKQREMKENTAYCAL